MKNKNKNSIFEIGKLYVDFEKHIIKVSGEAIELSYKGIQAFVCTFRG